jgi:hypothetical protein
MRPHEDVRRFFSEINAVVIPGTVREIKKDAFEDNPLTGITIGGNAAPYKTTFPNGFTGFYNHEKIEKKAGICVFENFF